MITNMDLHKFNFEIHAINTRHGTYIIYFYFVDPYRITKSIWIWK